MKFTFESTSLQKVFEVEEYLIRRNVLRQVTQKLQVWNTEIMKVEAGKIIYDMEEMVLMYHRFYAFIITMYETTKFNRIIVTQAIKFKKYSPQIKYSKSLGDYFITKWLPGMFTGREYFVRNFYYKWYKNINIFKEAKMKSCISQLYKMIRLPSLLCVYTFKKENQIIIKEAVTSKVVSIGMFENFVFPTNSTFRLTGRVDSVYSSCIFLNILIRAMNFGRSLYYDRFGLEVKRNGVEKRVNEKVEIKKTKKFMNEDSYIFLMIKVYDFIKSFRLKNKMEMMTTKRLKYKVKYNGLYTCLLNCIYILIFLCKISKKNKKLKKKKLYKIIYNLLKKRKGRKRIKFYIKDFLSNRKRRRKRRLKIKYYNIYKKLKKKPLFIQKYIKEEKGKFVERKRFLKKKSYNFSYRKIRRKKYKKFFKRTKHKLKQNKENKENLKSKIKKKC